MQKKSERGTESRETGYVCAGEARLLGSLLAEIKEVPGRTPASLFCFLLIDNRLAATSAAVVAAAEEQKQDKQTAAIVAAETASVVVAADCRQDQNPDNTAASVVSAKKVGKSESAVTSTVTLTSTVAFASTVCCSNIAHSLASKYLTYTSSYGRDKNLVTKNFSSWIFCAFSFQVMEID